MRKFLALASTAVMVGVTSLAAIAPAAAAPMNREQYVNNWCRGNPRDASCGDFNRNHGRWSDNQYRNWYQSHRGSRGFDPLAAGIFGFAAGAVAAGIANSANNSGYSAHQQRCAAAYRTYNPRTDLYTSMGHTRQCRL
jgi:hypothetical protein